MEPTAVIDIENASGTFPEKGLGQANAPSEIAGVLVVKNKIVSEFHGSGPDVVDKLSAWLDANGSPQLTCYNQDFDRRRLVALGLRGQAWGPDVKTLAARDVNAAKKEATLSNGRPKWPTLEEAAGFYGVSEPDGDAHSSTHDARLAARVFIAAVGREAPPGGVV